MRATTVVSIRIPLANVTRVALSLVTRVTPVRSRFRVGGVAAVTIRRLTLPLRPPSTALVFATNPCDPSSPITSRLLFFLPPPHSTEGVRPHTLGVGTWKFARCSATQGVGRFQTVRCSLPWGVELPGYLRYQPTSGVELPVYLKVPATSRCACGGGVRIRDLYGGVSCMREDTYEPC